MTHAVPTASDGDVAFSASTATHTSTPTPESTTANSDSRTFESTALNNSLSNGLSATTSVEEGNTFTVDEISHLVSVVEESGLGDFRYEHNDFSIEITRPGGLGFDADGRLKSSPETTAAPQYLPSPGISPPVQYVEENGADYGFYQDPADDSESETADASSSGQSDDDQFDSEDVDKQDPDKIFDSDFVVTSNRVGFFFSGAKNKPPLVNVGDTVAYNQPVCIIEQLGQQYVYLSEASGKVVKVFIEDGDAVEYGSQIMVIRPD